MNRHMHYTLTIETISPLHIGTGETLRPDEDYISDGNSGHIQVFNIDALYEATLSDSGEFDDRLFGIKPSEIYRRHVQADRQEDVFRYTFRGRPIHSRSEIREFIKDVYDRPYLPGSSLKGSLRTLLMWGAYSSESRVPSLSDLSKDVRFAAQSLERTVFAPGAQQRRDVPNMDAMRALRVADSLPVDTASLYLAAVGIYPVSRQQTQGVYIDVEAIAPRTVFRSQLTIENYGFVDEQAREVLHWNKLQPLFQQIPKIGRLHGGQRIAEEIEYYKERQAEQVLSFYAKLVKLWDSLANNEWLTQLGWGGGWGSKTLGNLISEQQDFESRVIKPYRLARGQRRPGDRFPKSRKLALNRDGEPTLPIGWVRMVLNEG